MHPVPRVRGKVAERILMRWMRWIIGQSGMNGPYITKLEERAVAKL